MPTSQSYETLDVRPDAHEPRVVNVTFNRPDIRNAFNETFIAELTDVCNRIAAKGCEVFRAVVFTGAGSAFCAGADLNWMSKQRAFTHKENVADAAALAKMYRSLHALPQPTIARVNGAAIGGGCGLQAACDIAIAADEAKLALTEVRLGILPAVISPYILLRVGERVARELMLTGERLDGRRAAAVGLVNRSVPQSRLDAEVARILDNILAGGPQALALCKQMLDRVPGMTLDEADAYNVDLIADIRTGDEGQEGMAAFFEKRPPSWK